MVYIPETLYGGGGGYTLPAVADEVILLLYAWVWREGGGGGNVYRVSSRNLILGGKLTDHVVLRPWRGEGRLHNYYYLGGK